MPRDWDGIFWKVQLAIFVFVAVSSGRRLTAGPLPPETLDGAVNVVLTLLAVGGAVAVAATREPLSTLARRSGEP